MTSGRKPKQPLYTLPHGIEVIGEYAPNAKYSYWRARIRPHPFFPNAKIRSGGFEIQRGRVILASQLGRALTRNDHAHHGDKNRGNDTIGNIELLSSAEHNRHHKIGFAHSENSRTKTSESLKLAYAEGRHRKSTISKRDELGRIAS